MRREIYNQKYGLAYGEDHICGLFIQIWKLNPKYGTHHFENQPDDANLVIDRDNLSGRIELKELVEIAGNYGFDLSAELPEEAIEI